MKNLPKKVRSKKLSSRVDLTAMVSVSFLLIIFFMVVGELSKPKVMDINFPDNDCCDCFPVYPEESRSFTILLDDNNELVYFAGNLENPIKKPQKKVFEKSRIMKELNNYNSLLLNNHKKGIVVFIKPCKKSNFGNLVSIIDVMKTCNIESYNIVNEFTPEESNLLASNQKHSSN
ncbi:ExbD/TolR family protein [Flavobacterium anhuiense]|uniref:ExbD/TolR family protein n=1 Tax=Flavobacterium anhuiense TaxID=459526 RepID=UPI003D96A1D6